VTPSAEAAPAAPPEPAPNWHAMDVAAAAKALATDPERGLSPTEARSRLERYGRNTLPEGKKKTLLAMVAGQFKDFLILILMAAAVVSFATGETTDALAIVAILILNAILGASQEKRASQALEALKRMSVPECEVVRGGVTTRISSEAVVPGDVLVLREGDYVPADLRLVETASLRINEASLTGESAPVEKTTRPHASDASLADRLNMAYAGTVVTYGRGRGVVVATGLEREIGRIATLLQQKPETVTPLQKRLAGFGKVLGVITLVVCAATFVLGIVRGQPAWEMFMTAVSLAVAAIPEGLPAIVTVVLALGVYRMSRRHAIVRKLPAVETLGCTTTICTDKTGTLTENRMSVTRVWPADADDERPEADTPSRRLLVRIAALSNDAHIESGNGSNARFGDPTELALVEFAEAEGVHVRALRAEHPRLGEVPFSSERKRMSTVHAMDGQRRLLVKGAPDVLLPLCTARVEGEAAVPLDDAGRQRIQERMDAMAGEALRVLAFATKDLPPDGGDVTEADETDLVFVGLAGMRDALRSEAAPALQQAAQAGIRTLMVTGDNPATAEAIARDLGMIEPGDECLTGADLAKVEEADLADRIRHIRVFARVWPEQKLKIVRALQAEGEVVAMTGDGVNDAPALQQADIGVAMGLTGTDVAKGAADIILTDDNFATIVRAVAEGRVIFDNIRKFIIYLLACNLGEVLAVLVPVLIGLGTPLLPVQILLINLVTDGLPALALGVDCPEPDVMERRPRRSTEGILVPRLIVLILFNAGFIGLAVILSFHLGFRSGGIDVARTMAFITLGLAELVRAFSFRSTRRNVWQIDPRTNLYLVGACVLSAGVLLAAALIPGARDVCRTAPLTAGQWALALVLCLIPTAAYELWKVLGRVAGRRG